MKTYRYLLTLFALHSFMAQPTCAIAQVATPATVPGVSVQERGVDNDAKRQIDSSAIIITWSENKDELRGFSIKQGRWSILKLPPQERMAVTVSGNVAAIEIDDSLVAYSGEKGWWDVIPIRKDSTATAFFSNNLVTIQVAEHLYTFAASTGQWTSPTDPDLQPAEEKLRIYVNEQQLRDEMDISLKRSDRFLAHRNRQIQIRPRFEGKQDGDPGSWYEVEISAGRKSYLDEVVKTFKRIELVPPRTKTPNNNSERATLHDADLRPTIAVLREKMTRHENEAVTLGKLLSSQKTQTKEDRQKLEEIVAQSFDARQSMQVLESNLMSARFEKVKQNLDSRQNLRGRIVERRIAELLDPNSEATAWQTTQTDLQAVAGATLGAPWKASPKSPYSNEIAVADKQDERNRNHWNEKAIWEQIGLLLSAEPASSILRSTNLEDYKGGLRVIDVRPDSPAQLGDVQAGDIVVGIMDWQTPSLDSLEWVLSNSQFLNSRESKYYFIRKGVRRTIVLPTLRPDNATRSVDDELKKLETMQPMRQPSDFVKILRGKKDQFEVRKKDANSRQEIVSRLAGQTALNEQAKGVLKSQTEELANAKRAAETALDDWKQIWSEYQTELRLLQLDVDEVSVRHTQLEKDVDRSKKLLNELISQYKMEEEISNLKIVAIQLQRATERHRLFAEIETAHPEFCPVGMKK